MLLPQKFIGAFVIFNNFLPTKLFVGCFKLSKQFDTPKNYKLSKNPKCCTDKSFLEVIAPTAHPMYPPMHSAP